MAAETKQALDEPTAARVADRPASANDVVDGAPAGVADDVIVHEAQLLDLLGTVQSLVCSAVGLWRELILEQGTIPLAAVSVATNTCLYEAMTIIHAAEILYPLCFENNIDLTDKSTYWTHLSGLRNEEAVDKAFVIFAEPADNCLISSRQAHFPYRFLGLDWKDGLAADDPEKGHTGGLVPLRTAIALEYAYQVHEMYADPQDVLKETAFLSQCKDEVEALMSETEVLLQDNADTMAATNPVDISRSKTTVERMRPYANKARDILALGFVAETVECPRLQRIVQLLGCPLLRMFACSYESMRLSTKFASADYPSRLDNFFQHPLVGRLLWLDGRPGLVVNAISNST